MEILGLAGYILGKEPQIAMKAARILVALVLFFLLFGLPAMMSIQFLRMQKTPASGGKSSLDSNLLRGFFHGSESPPVDSSLFQGADAQTPAQNRLFSNPRETMKGGSGSGPNFPPSAGSQEGGGSLPGSAPEESAAMLDREETGAFPASASGASPAAYYGAETPASPASNAHSAGGTAQSEKLGGGTGGSASEAARTQKGKPARTAGAGGRAQATGQNQQNLLKASAQSTQAAAMSKDPQLLDGAKDHAGKAFDGNSKYRKNIPLDKYTDSFGQESIRVKEQNPVDLGP